MYQDEWKSPETLRKEVERQDRLAKAAESEGDVADMVECQRRANELRRLARRKEIE